MSAQTRHGIVLSRQAQRLAKAIRARQAGAAAVEQRAIVRRVLFEQAIDNAKQILVVVNGLIRAYSSRSIVNLLGLRVHRYRPGGRMPTEARDRDGSVQGHRTPASPLCGR